MRAPLFQLPKPKRVYFGLEEMGAVTIYTLSNATKVIKNEIAKTEGGKTFPSPKPVLTASVKNITDAGVDELKEVLSDIKTEKRWKKERAQARIKHNQLIAQAEAEGRINNLEQANKFLDDLWKQEREKRDLK